MRLDLSSFKMAITSMQQALDVLKPDSISQFNEATQSVIKAGVIQNFEFTYELSHKILKRYLVKTLPNPSDVDEMSFADMIRTGSELGLLASGWDVWKKYRAARAITSHTYDEDKADVVLSITYEFLQEAQYLLAQLERRNTGAD
ncbi:nucleotidyltransferase substrate binding protein [Candidatus Magnetomonas plexicatena]|uniref:nucleotidyltransferase substrate binding protein n=1 Tax=Candidatus Magnetomonas plexicatena TaxID=2552947 RepID=UPI001C7452D4|nr:nucleotidyltransferase [Nitrospirales bacterium LBB_01]